MRYSSYYDAIRRYWQNIALFAPTDLISYRKIKG